MLIGKSGGVCSDLEVYVYVCGNRYIFVQANIQVNICADVRTQIDRYTQGRGVYIRTVYAHIKMYF